MVTVLVAPLSHRLLDPCEANYITPASSAYDLTLGIELLMPSLAHQLNESYNPYNSLPLCPPISFLVLSSLSYVLLIYIFVSPAITMHYKNPNPSVIRSSMHVHVVLFLPAVLFLLHASLPKIVFLSDSADIQQILRMLIVYILMKNEAIMDQHSIDSKYNKENALAFLEDQWVILTSKGG
jgi:hypothetical protein